MIALRDVRRAVAHLLCVCGGLLIMLALVNYGSDVIYRHSANDWIEEVSDADGGLYTAKYAYLGSGWILLRIYKTGQPELLAERTYQYLDRAKLL
jgi:hypothetical protein